MATTAAPGVRTVNPYLHGSFAPTAAEATVGEGFEVIGQVPRDLALSLIHISEPTRPY